MNIRVFDLEANGLLDKVTKVHCLTYYDLQTKTFESLTNYRDIAKVFEDDVIWAGHNIIRYDFPVLKKILGVDLPKFVIDTLAISWYLYPERKVHGLEEWGEEFGILKPEIKDWFSLSFEDYIHRCEEDVKINTKLWNQQKRFLDAIYQGKNLREFLEYLYFKMDCVREQEELGLTLDLPKIEKCVREWSAEQEEKYRELESVMPKVAKKKTKIYQNAAEIDGNVFTKGDLFFQSAVDRGAVVEDIKLSKIIDWEDPNSGSFVQIKKWLDSLGWEPEHIKYVRDKKTNEVKLIPQIKSKFDEGELCPSIVRLFEKEPKLELLQGLFVLTHRISIMEGFIKDQKEGKIYPSLGGLTNTLRLKHKVVVNLPAIYKKYGQEIRSSIIAPEGHTLIGSDLKNIESMTRNHYIFPFDPDYVNTLLDENFDSHTDIAKLGGLMTEDEEKFFQWYEKQK